MREIFSVALARHIGQELTVDVARQIVQEACATPDFSIDPAIFGSMRSGSIVIQAERFREVLPDLKALHMQHYAETERHRHGIELDPDIDAALQEDRCGGLVQFTARQDGRLVGNLRVYIRTSRHTRTRYMVEDTLYLLPEYRKGRTALRMLQFMEQSMRALGVMEMRATTKKVNRTDKLLEHLGWEPVATELVKIIKE